ncbi:MAG: hypothetical protein BWY15_00454 [Firmicutes bacterium ADurb.Bin193]|nr:MAG: hypothetical protein BWY15_00454 [Firmicutes bacterium ADurb.Bin193]
MKIKRLMIEGKVYVETAVAMESLCTNEFGVFTRWRKMGMPYIAVKGKKRIKYFYNIEDCHRWFLGKDFSAPGAFYDHKAIAAVYQ